MIFWWDFLERFCLDKFNGNFIKKKFEKEKFNEFSVILISKRKTEKIPSKKQRANRTTVTIKLFPLI